MTAQDGAPRVLVADANEILLEAVTRELARRPLRVARASTPAQTIAELEREPPSVALIDLALSRADGLDLLATAARCAPETRVILLVPFATAQDHEVAIERGAVAVLSKPFSRAELLDAIERATDDGDGFQGNLHGLSLQDVLQLYNQKRASVTLRLTGRSGRGEIDMQDGEVVHASYGTDSGEAALRAMLEAPAGTIRTSVLHPGPRTIHRSFLGVMLEAMRAIDEAGHVGRSAARIRYDTAGPLEPLDPTAAGRLEPSAFDPRTDRVESVQLGDATEAADRDGDEPTVADPALQPVRRAETPPPPSGTFSGPPRDPPLPSPELPADLLWPEHVARVVLARRRTAPTRRRDDLVLTGPRARRDDPPLVFQVGEHALQTSRSRRYTDEASARQALLEAARRKMRLGALAPPSSAFALQPSSDGSWWLWSLMPWLTPLSARIEDAARIGDEEALGRRLARFAAAAAAAMLLAVRHRVALDVHPSTFAIAGGVLCYIGDRVEESERLPELGAILLEPVDAFAAHPRAIETYVEALAREMSTRLSSWDVRQLDVAGQLEAAGTSAPPEVARRARSLHERLEARGAWNETGDIAIRPLPWEDAD